MKNSFEKLFVRRKKLSPRGFARAGYNRMGKTLEEEEEEEEDEEDVSESAYSNNNNQNRNSNMSNGSEVTQASESAADVSEAIKVEFIFYAA